MVLSVLEDTSWGPGVIAGGWAWSPIRCQGEGQRGHPKSMPCTPPAGAAWEGGSWFHCPRNLGYGADPEAGPLSPGQNQEWPVRGNMAREEQRRGRGPVWDAIGEGLGKFRGGDAQGCP